MLKTTKNFVSNNRPVLRRNRTVRHQARKDQAFGGLGALIVVAIIMACVFLFSGSTASASAVETAPATTSSGWFDRSHKAVQAERDYLIASHEAKQCVGSLF